MGKLVQDHSDGAYAVSIVCFECGRSLRLADAIIDSEGPAFRAYYCADCVPAGPVNRCNRPGCTRCGK